MSTFQSLGLVAEIYQPLLAGGAFLQSLIGEVADYTHVISAYGGFDTATINLTGRSEDLEDWIEHGLGRHVVVWDSNLVEVWEGFVDSVDISIGLLNLTVGPLTDIANRVSVLYDSLNTAANPPTTQGSTVTTITENAVSQIQYGIWEKVLSAGSATTANAQYAQATYLAENAYPARTQTVNNKASASVSIVLNLKGYYYWTSGYVYTQASVSGTVTATALIQAILTAAPNSGILSSDYSRLDTNAMLVPAYSNNRDYADGVLKYIVGLGDVNGARWTFGYYENRRPYYQIAPTTLAYTQSLQSQDTGVYDLSGGRVYPWSVRPARWLFLNDFLIGRSMTTQLNTDPRNMFIEQVTFKAPYEVTITGGKLTQLGQILAQISAGGLF